MNEREKLWDNVCLWKAHGISKSEDLIHAIALYFLHVTSEPKFPFLNMESWCQFSVLLWKLPERIHMDAPGTEPGPHYKYEWRITGKTAPQEEKLTPTSTEKPGQRRVLPVSLTRLKTLGNQSPPIREHQTLWPQGNEGASFSLVLLHSILCVVIHLLVQVWIVSCCSYA